MLVEYVLDGSRIGSLEQFYDEIGRVLIPDSEWGRNLDAFDDILWGGFGTPEEGFIIRWSQSALSKESLGYPETVRRLEVRLDCCHPSHCESVARQLADASQGVGPTVFDWLVEIIQRHGPDGDEGGNNVHLRLD